MGVESKDIVVPKNLAEPLYEVSNFLGVKYGICSIFNSMWELVDESVPLEERECLSIQDIRLRWHFTIEYQDRLFLGTSVIGTFYLFKSFKQMYEIAQLVQYSPELQELAASKMEKIRNYLKLMNEAALEIIKDLNVDHFYCYLRPFILGFNNVFFEGVNQRLSSPGGSGGFDPLFQVFEGTMGVSHSEDIKRVENSYQSGIIASHHELIKRVRESCEFQQIREYFSLNEYLRQAYNSVLKEYVHFHQIHSELISKFILKVQKSSSGSSGVAIKTVLSRHVKLLEHLLK